MLSLSQDGDSDEHNAAELEAKTLLVGKLFSERPPNRAGAKEAIARSCSFVQDLTISDGPNDCFIFSFSSLAAREQVLKQCP